MDGVAKTLGHGLSNAGPAGPAHHQARASETARAGRAAPALLLALFLLGVLGILLLRRGDGGAAGERAGPARPAGAPQASHAERAGTPRAPERSEALAPAGGEPQAPQPVEPEPGLASGARADPHEFDGQALLRGHVEIHGDLPPPERWTLSLRPSTTLYGREHAEPREIEFPGDELDFVVADLPLGGYDVQALAEGRNGHTMPVLLTRASTSPFIVIDLLPASWLEGELVDSESLPVEGMGLVLSSPDGRTRLQAQSDAAGRFRFDGVRDGPYQILVGDPAGPLLPPRAVQVNSPGMRLPALELPPLGTLDVFVLDPDDLFVADAPVRGSGTLGGVLEGRTDADGRVVFRYLLPGRWRLRAEHPLDGERTSTRVSVDLVAGRTERVELRFLP